MASERMLPLLRENSIAIPIVVCTRTVYFFEIICHPFFVFGQREEALFEPPKFAGFGRQTSRFQQFCGFFKLHFNSNQTQLTVTQIDGTVDTVRSTATQICP